MALLIAIREREYGLRGKFSLQRSTEQRFLPPLPQQKLPTGSARGALCIAVHPDGNMLAVSHTDRVVRIIDINKSQCEVVGTLEMKRIAWSLAFNPRATCDTECHSKRNCLLAAGDLDGEVRLFDLHAGQVGIFSVKSQLASEWGKNSSSQGSESQSSSRAPFGDDEREEQREASEQTNSANAVRSFAVASLAFHPYEPILLIAAGNTLFFYNWQQACLNGVARCSSVLDRVRWARFDPLGTCLYTAVMCRNRVDSERERERSRLALRRSPTTCFLGWPGDQRRSQQQHVSESERREDVIVVPRGATPEQSIYTTSSSATAAPAASRASANESNIHEQPSTSGVEEALTHRYRYVFSDASSSSSNTDSNASFTLLDLTAPRSTASNSANTNTGQTSNSDAASISSSVLNVVSEANRLAETANSAASVISSALETNVSAGEYRDEQLGSVMRALGDAHEELERIEVRMRSLRDRLRVLNTVASARRTQTDAVENNSTAGAADTDTDATPTESNSHTRSTDSDSPLAGAARQFALAADAFSEQVGRLSTQSNRLTAVNPLRRDARVLSVTNQPPTSAIQRVLADDSAELEYSANNWLPRVPDTLPRPSEARTGSNGGLATPPFHHRYRLFTRLESEVQVHTDRPSTSASNNSSADSRNVPADQPSHRWQISTSRTALSRPSYSYYRMTSFRPTTATASSSSSTSVPSAPASNAVPSTSVSPSSSLTSQVVRRIDARPIPLIRVEHAYARNEADARPADDDEDPRRRTRIGSANANPNSDTPAVPRVQFPREWMPTRRFGVAAGTGLGAGAPFLDVPAAPIPPVNVLNEQAFELSGRVFTNYRNHAIEPWAVCRVQRWHLSEMLRDAEAGFCQLPSVVDLDDDTRNVLITNVLIQNDNTIDVARNGRFLACFVRRGDEANPQLQSGPAALNMSGAPQKYVCLVSLDGASCGQQLVRIAVEPQSATLSISPESRYLLLGLAGSVSRLDYLFGFAWTHTPAGREHVVARCYELATVPNRKRKYPFIAASTCECGPSESVKQRRSSISDSPGTVKAATGLACASATTASGQFYPCAVRTVYPFSAANRQSAALEGQSLVPSSATFTLRLLERSSILHTHPTGLFGAMMTFEVNAVQWLPLTGQGYVYATSQGNVYVGRSLQPPKIDVEADSARGRQAPADLEAETVSLDEEFGFVIL